MELNVIGRLDRLNIVNDDDYDAFTDDDNAEKVTHMLFPLAIAVDQKKNKKTKFSNHPSFTLGS